MFICESILYGHSLPAGIGSLFARTLSKNQGSGARGGKLVNAIGLTYIQARIRPLMRHSTARHSTVRRNAAFSAALVCSNRATLTRPIPSRYYIGAAGLQRAERKGKSAADWPRTLALSVHGKRARARSRRASHLVVRTTRERTPAAWFRVVLSVEKKKKQRRSA